MAALPKGTIKREVRRLVALGGPVALTQLGTMSLGVVDMLMVGQLGVHELDAASLGNLWIFGTLILGMGLLFGLDPIISQAHGARDGARAGLTAQQGVVVALLASVPMTLAWLSAEDALGLLGQAPEFAASAHRYVTLQIPSIPAFLIFIALRQYLQGRGVVMPALFVIIAANAFNVLANWALIFGNLGLPALGLDGAAIATAATRLFQLVALIILIRAARLHQGAWVPWSRRVFDRADLIRIVKYGAPISAQYGLEAWAFQGATLMSGWLGEVELAAHSIVLNLASLSFMIPLGMSIGAATRVGNLLGAQRPRDAQRAAFVALGMGGAVMAMSALAFVVLRRVLPGLYTDDATVVAMAATILPIAAAFQLFDGVQVVGGGILRGMGNTVPAAVFNLVGFYALALPLAGWLAFSAGWDLVGVWWGLALGLALVATALVLWISRRGPARARALAYTPTSPP
ncbi:MATE family efflux transporter [Haliangium sp.]|uniref:MATE family efflux transporter n=1 Tax=Haliangium sp. TaxID=2663208 RepID=UPI003D0A7C9B